MGVIVVKMINKNCKCKCCSNSNDLLHQEITWEEYQKLSAAEKNSDIIWFIKDLDEKRTSDLTDQISLKESQDKIESFYRYLQSVESKIKEIKKWIK